MRRCVIRPSRTIRRAAIVTCALGIGALWGPGVVVADPTTTTDVPVSAIDSAAPPTSGTNPDDGSEGGGSDDSPGDAAILPLLQLDPTSGTLGTSVSVTVPDPRHIDTAFAAAIAVPRCDDRIVDILWADQVEPVATGDVASSLSFSVPDAATGDAYAVTAVCHVRGSPVTVASGTFTVLPVAQPASLPPTTPVVGAGDEATPPTVVADPQLASRGTNTALLFVPLAVVAVSVLAYLYRLHHRSQQRGNTPQVTARVHPDPAPRSAIEECPAPGETTFALHIRTQWPIRTVDIEEAPHVHTADD